MLTLEPIDNHHLMAFTPLDIQAEEFETVCQILYGKNDMHNFCFLSSGVPVLLIGMREKWEKVYDTYTIFSPAWRPAYYKSVARAAKGYFERLDYDRIEHLCHCDREWTGKMAELFGFKRGPLLRKYVNGKDYQMYEIVRA